MEKAPLKKREKTVGRPGTPQHDDEDGHGHFGLGHQRAAGREEYAGRHRAGVRGAPGWGTTQKDVDLGPCLLGFPVRK